MYTLGIDIGSTTSKCAVLKDGKELVAHSLQTGGLGTGGPEEAYRDFFETNDIYEAKDFAMRLAFDETNLVCVRDEKRDEIVRDFDAEVYR